MPNINDIPEISKLLAERSLTAKAIVCIQARPIDTVEIAFVKVKKEPANETPEETSGWISLFVCSDPRETVSRDTLGLDERDGMIQDFFIRFLFDHLGEIDMALFDLGFEFAEGYENEVKKMQTAIKRPLTKLKEKESHLYIEPKGSMVKRSAA